VLCESTRRVLVLRQGVAMIARCAALIVIAGPGLATALEPPRFPGRDTTVAVSRATGKIAVCSGGALDVWDRLDAASPAVRVDVSGSRPAVMEFCGNTIHLVAHEVQGLARVHIALHFDGRERLAWPNEGISPVFPGELSRLTLDGRGVAGALVLDSAVRLAFGLASDIPNGAGVVASYRFAGERLIGRGSELFREVLALAPDDMLIALRDGGMLRYGPGGVAWRFDEAGKIPWRATDSADGLVLTITGQGEVVALALDGGTVKWRWRDADSDGVGVAPRDARLLRGGLVLVARGGAAGDVVLVDPAAGRIVSRDVRAMARELGIEPVVEAGDPLAGVLDVSGGESRRTVLIRGVDGWRVVPIS